MENNQSKIDLVDSRVTELLERLAKEDELRAAFEADPRGVFAEHGIEIDPSLVFETKITLPSKQELQEKLGRYVDRVNNVSALMKYAV